MERLDKVQIFKSTLKYGGSAVTNCLIGIGADKNSLASVIRCEFFIRMFSAPNYQETPLGIIQMRHTTTAEKIRVAPEPLKIGMTIKPSTPRCKEGHDHSSVLVWTPGEGWYLVDAEHTPKKRSNGSYEFSWEADRIFKPKDKKFKLPEGFQEFKNERGGER